MNAYQNKQIVILFNYFILIDDISLKSVFKLSFQLASYLKFQ